MTKRFAILGASLLLWSASAFGASVPKQLSYEGQLFDASGNPVNGIVSLKFEIFDAATAGNSLWSDTLSAVAVVDGLYSLTLGTTTGDPFPPGLFDGSLRYVEITVNADTLSPRQSIGSVAYAITADSLQGGALAIDSSNGNLTFNGNSIVSSSGAWAGGDLFAAAMQGLAPAVVGNSYSFNGSWLSNSCGAPSSINFTVPPAGNPGGNAGVAGGSFGQVVYTQNGAFNLSQGNGGPLSIKAGCTSICYGPVTFFVNNPSPTTTNLIIQGWMDDGPSPIYVDGVVAVANATTNMQSTGQVVPLPSGAHSISFVACSGNDSSLAFFVSTQFISQYNLTIDYDKTFHRNGN
jgi:hypothetical protein